MTVPQDNWLAQRAAACPDRLAVRSHDGDLTYAELDSEASALAAELEADGVQQGVPALLDLPPGREFVCRLHALMKVGAIALPVPQRMTKPECDAWQARNMPSGLSGTPGVTQGPLDEADAVLCRLETSGTTGVPKSVDLTCSNYLWSAIGSAFNLGIDPSDRWLCCLPLNHVGGLSIPIRSVIFGTGAVIHDGFDVDRVTASLAEDGVTVVSLVTTQLLRLLEAGADLTGPRAIVLGGGPVPLDAIAEAESVGARIVQTYGMSETCSQVTTLAPAEARGRAGSSGRPAFGTEVRVVDGEIHVRGPVVAPGHADDDGWLRTGDLGRIDEDGFLYVEGRLGDVIVTGGENVMPTEVEAALLEHPDVEEAAVVGRTDPEWQEAVTAFVVLRSGAAEDADALRAHCASLIAGYKVPKRFEFAGELPRSPSGKLLRRELR